MQKKMAGMPVTSQDPDAWRTPPFRQKVIKNIEDAMVSSGSSLSQIKSPIDMENQVFQKAKSRDEYLSLIAKLILYVRDNAKKQNAVMGMGMGNMPMGSGGAGVGPSPMGMAPGGPPGGATGGGQDPLNALTNLTKQNMGSSGNQAQMPPGMMGHPGMGHQRPPFSGYQQMGAAMNMGPRGMGPGHMQGMRPDPYGQMSGHPGMGGGSMSAGPPMSQGMQMAPNNPQMQVMSQPQPSMVPQSLSSAPSPVTLSSPSAMMGPSPVSRGQVMTGAPSPSTSLNTPGNPNNPSSVGSAPSPANRNAEEEKVYLDKLQQLQKYVEPLKRMINKIEKDDERKKDHHKMKNLLEILTDPSKRMPLETLNKCQQVLEKMEWESRKMPPSLTSTSLSQIHGQNMCQPLLDKIASQATKPMFNHTLHRTFAPAMDALYGPPIKPPSPPPPTKKQKNDPSHAKKVSNILQGEIARLNPRFNVNLDPAHHKQSKTLHLICKLEDKNLPSVPPIAITVPENYPKTSPSCDTEAIHYDSTPFLEKVQKTLSSHLVNMPNRFSITALLNLWEMSVRKASHASSVSV